MTSDNSNSKSTHTIQLRGPWQVSLLKESGELLGSHRLRIKADVDWSSWHVHLTNECRHVSLSRNFKWPGPQPPPQLVELKIQGECPDHLLLNGASIGLSSNILDSLLLTNQLTLSYDLPLDSKCHAPDISGVWLEIND